MLFFFFALKINEIISLIKIMTLLNKTTIKKNKQQKLRKKKLALLNQWPNERWSLVRSVLDEGL